MPLILNEDNALTTFLRGMTVSDKANSVRPVGVWFGFPDQEIRAQAYPYLTIDLVDISEDLQRSMRGIITVPYTPEGLADPAPGFSYTTEMPIPLALDYQVTSWSRNPQHDRHITAQMLHFKIPFRYGGLNITADGTCRPMFLTNYFSRPQIDPDGKRLFRTIYNVRVLSEMFLADIHTIQQVAKVTYTITQTAINSSVTQP